MGNCQTNTKGTVAVASQKKPGKLPEETSTTHSMIQGEEDKGKPKEQGDNEKLKQSDGMQPSKTPVVLPSKEQWRGYSSGASSDRLSDSLDESQVFAANDGLCRDGERPNLDPLHLKSMRDVMHSNGDLTQCVVRLETPFGKPIEDIYDGVHDGPFLGQGVSGLVRLVKHRATGVQYACKCLDIGLIQTEAGLRQLRNEISIMCQLDHPNIVRIEEVYESTNTIYLLQELCLGGDLFDRLDEQPDIHYTEAECAKLVKQILSAIRYLHSKGVIHRDLKLENFLFSTPAPDSELKMIDFGLSKHFDMGEVQHEQVGTPYTCAPEILKGSYDEKSDIWSLGVITYLLLSGETPFGGCYADECMSDVRNNILNGSFTFEPEDIWENVSDLSKKFVKRLLNVDPKNRPTAKEVQRDEWLQVYAKKDGTSKSCNQLSPRIVSALVGFKEYSEMRRLLHEVLSFTLLPEQIVELREEFQKIDTDGDGEITLEAMKDVLMSNANGGALGDLTEEEVEDIFNALRVNKSDSTIRWHEFIAAGLSQCTVDERNLQLAFDRLDVDRKGYISFDDLTDLLGHAPATLESLEKMWKESMQQCSCKGERITYSDFVMLMKGQTRRASHRASMVWSPKTPTKPLITPEELAALSNIPEFEGSEDSEEIVVGNKFYRKRSKSFDDASLESDRDIFDDGAARRVSFPPRVRPSVGGSGEHIRLIANEVKGPLLANREQYKKHRDLRLALVEASKAFDMKCQLTRAATEGKLIGSPLEGAGLIMKRGSAAPKDLEDAHQRALFDAAVRRGGRHAHEKKGDKGHRRKRTQSDVTGMLLLAKA